MKRRAQNTKHLKRIIVNASASIKEESLEENKQIVITERLRMEDEEKFNATMGNSPHRKD